MLGGTNIFTRIFLAVALFIVLILETSRIPVDDPATHLELTMVHEAMILEYSGRQLALVEWGASIKQFFYIGLISNILMSGIGIPVNTFLDGIVMLGILTVKFIIITVVVAVTEIRSVKTKFFNIPNLTTAALVFSLIGFVLSFI
jgi:formate hydrogenlyase subunit 4